MVTYADRPWTKHYDDFVPESLAPYPDKLIHDYLPESAAKYPDRAALISTVKLPLIGRQDKRMTYRELDQASDALAAALVAQGLNAGDRVALIMPNTIQFAISYFAVLKAGGVVTGTNPTYPAKRMAYQINDCDAEIAICLSLFYKTIQDIRAETKLKTVIVTNIKEYLPTPARVLFSLLSEKRGGHYIETLHSDDLWLQDVLTQYRGQKADVRVSPDDVALFQYTGGTTGVSKGAMGTHRALVANTIQMQTWSGFDAGKFDHHEQMQYLGAIPMFHVYGLLVLLTQAIVAGGSIILVPNPREIDALIDIIADYQPQVMLGVPTLYNAISAHSRVQSGAVSLESFVLNTSGSAPLLTKTKDAYDALTSSPIVEAYGMSETFTAVTANPMDGTQKMRSVGLPYPDVDMKIVSVDDPDTVLDVGEIGELVVHAPNLMKGYHAMPTETANALRADETGKLWLYTGDIAKMDEDGYFYIVDRKKDMALIGGYNVYPATVEDALKAHPAVFEVAVAAIPHPEKAGQEALKAWVVFHEGQTASEEELIQHCEDYLLAYEIPRRYAFVAELPKTEVGKTLRRELVRMEIESADALARDRT